MADLGTICSRLCLYKWPMLRDMCISGGHEPTQLSRLFLLLLSSYEKAVEVNQVTEQISICVVVY